MDDLHLIGVHEDGEYVLLGGPDGTPRFRLKLDDALRAAIRWERSVGAARATDEPLRPRDVQAMIRAGATAAEAAQRAGWTVEKVHRYEGPILAERSHIAQLAGSAVLRSRTVGFGAPTLAERVSERLGQRDVAADDVTWDSWRSEEGHWTVELHFNAGGRPRTASWRFDRPTMTVSAVDDEARWLSEEDQVSDSPAVRHVVTSGRAAVYDIEADGGLRATQRGHDDRSTPPEAARNARTEPTHPSDPDDQDDLIAAMRERSGARSRRRGTRRSSISPTSLPPDSGDVDEALPMEQIDYEPGTVPLPPSAHAHPDLDGLDAHPQPEAEAYAQPQVGMRSATRHGAGSAVNRTADHTVDPMPDRGDLRRLDTVEAAQVEQIDDHDDLPALGRPHRFDAGAVGGTPEATDEDPRHDLAEPEAHHGVEETEEASDLAEHDKPPRRRELFPGIGSLTQERSADAGSAPPPEEAPPAPSSQPSSAPRRSAPRRTTRGSKTAAAQHGSGASEPSPPPVATGRRRKTTDPTPAASAAEQAPDSSEATPQPTAAPSTPRRSGQRTQPTGRQRAKSQKRPRQGVPAWDDIVFGGGAPPPE